MGVPLASGGKQATVVGAEQARGPGGRCQVGRRGQLTARPRGPGQRLEHPLLNAMGSCCRVSEGRGTVMWLIEEGHGNTAWSSRVDGTEATAWRPGIPTQSKEAGASGIKETSHSCPVHSV